MREKVRNHRREEAKVWTTTVRREHVSDITHCHSSREKCLTLYNLLALSPPLTGQDQRSGGGREGEACGGKWTMGVAQTLYRTRLLGTLSGPLPTAEGHCATVLEFWQFRKYTSNQKKNGKKTKGSEGAGRRYVSCRRCLQKVSSSDEKRSVGVRTGRTMTKYKLDLFFTKINMYRNTTIEWGYGSRQPDREPALAGHTTKVAGGDRSAAVEPKRKAVYRDWVLFVCGGVWWLIDWVLLQKRTMVLRLCGHRFRFGFGRRSEFVLAINTSCSNFMI